MSKTDAKKIVKKYTAALRKANYPFSAVYLFGSYAKGNSRKDSDIDVAVFSRELDRDLDKARFKLWHLTRDVDVRIEPHGFSIKDFKEDWQPMVHEVKKTGVRIA